MLVVDDEPIVRKIANPARAYGSTVVTAGDGREAVARIPRIANTQLTRWFST